MRAQYDKETLRFIYKANLSLKKSRKVSMYSTYILENRVQKSFLVKRCSSQKELLCISEPTCCIFLNIFLRKILHTTQYQVLNMMSKREYI